jgi:hypothetical protein
MKKDVSRLLPPEQIPNSLWDSARSLLTLPRQLEIAYDEVIRRSGLAALVNERKKDSSPIGGLDQESADQHFAWAFDGSAARAALAVLDPKSELGTTSDIFLELTAGESLALVDAPCGAGAATIAFLTVVAELRDKGVLPRLPLGVKLVWGEISEASRVHAVNMLSAVEGTLEDQAIFVDHRIDAWDVLDQTSTTSLVKAMLSHGAGCSARMVVVANFSGFLVGEGKQKKADPQLNELFRYASGPGCFAIWIEPNTNKATSTGGVFPWIYGRIIGAWKKFARPDRSATPASPHLGSEATFRIPLRPSETAQVRLTIMPIELMQEPSA